VNPQEKLVYMANQIARNFAALGEDAAVDAAADHLRRFWDPAMRARILERAVNPDHGLSPLAARAVAQLQADGGVAR
jgi:formate dehydrogenase subunit delta